jgi:hypothetical protein
VRKAAALRQSLQLIGHAKANTVCHSFIVDSSSLAAAMPVVTGGRMFGRA